MTKNPHRRDSVFIAEVALNPLNGRIRVVDRGGAFHKGAISAKLTKMYLFVC
jgi:hypothetical protein